MSGNLNLNNNRIVNLPVPRSGQNDVMIYSDFETKFFKSQYNDVNCQGHRLFNIGSNTNADQVINRKYVEDFYYKRDGSYSLSGNMKANNNKITSLKAGTAATDSINKAQMDSELLKKADLTTNSTQTFKSRVQVPDFNQASHSGNDIVNLKHINNTFLSKTTGGTMQNPIQFKSDLDNNKRQIHNLGNPQFNSSAVNRSYVDTRLNTKANSTSLGNYLRKDGSNKLTSNLDLSSTYKVINSIEPTNDHDLSTKNYVDTNVKKISSHTISSSHTPTNVFKYLMQNVNQWSDEYHIELTKSIIGLILLMNTIKRRFISNPKKTLQVIFDFE